MARKKLPTIPAQDNDDSPIVTVERKKTIRRRRYNSLSQLMREYPEQLANLTQSLSMGATLTAAACSIGLDPNTLMQWIARGKEQKTGVYRELWEMVRQGVGLASVIAEATVHKRDPMAWLRIGPRRILSNEWSDNAANELANTPSTGVDKAAAVSVTLINGHAQLPGDAIMSALQELIKAGAVVEPAASTSGIKNPPVPAPQPAVSNAPPASSTGLGLIAAPHLQ